MSDRVISDGVLQLHYVETIADKTSPTEGEIAGGQDLSGYLLPDGLNLPFNGQTVDASDVSSAFNKTAPGTFGGDQGSVTLYRDTGADTAWVTLPRGTDGFLVVARFGGSGSDDELEDGDPVEVWPISVISRNPAQIARNQLQRFTADVAITDEPEQDATVAGS